MTDSDDSLLREIGRLLDEDLSAEQLEVVERETERMEAVVEQGCAAADQRAATFLGLFSVFSGLILDATSDGVDSGFRGLLPFCAAMSVMFAFGGAVSSARSLLMEDVHPPHPRASMVGGDDVRQVRRTVLKARWTFILGKRGLLERKAVRLNDGVTCILIALTFVMVLGFLLL